MRLSRYSAAAVLLFGFCVGSSSTAARNPLGSRLFQEDAFQRGLSALKENRFEEAYEALTTAKQEHPHDAKIRTFLGIALVQLGKTTEASAEYQEAIHLDPRFEPAYRNYGFLLWTQRQFDAAREILTRAIELASDDGFAHYYLGRVQLDAREYANALRELKLSGVPLPSDPDFLIQIATGYEVLGERQEAEKILEQLSAASLDDVRTAQVASLLLAINKNESAIAVLKKISNRPPPKSAHWTQFDLALAYLASGDYEKALQQSRAYLEFARADFSQGAPSDQAYALVGIAHARLGHGDLSVQALQRAATLAPEQEENWMNLSRELMELGRYPEAITASQEAVAANPKSYALHLRLGAAQLAAGHYKEAESAFRTLVDAGDPLPTSYVGLAQVLLREGRAGEAAATLLAAKQKLGENFLLSYFLGLSLDRSGKRIEAIAAYQDAVRLEPKNAQAHLGLGTAELASGRVNDAIAEFEESLRLDPKNAQARRLLTQAHFRAGHPEKDSQDFEDKQPAAEGDLVGDFLLPSWQQPSEH